METEKIEKQQPVPEKRLAYGPAVRVYGVGH